MSELEDLKDFAATLVAMRSIHAKLREISKEASAELARYGRAMAEQIKVLYDTDMNCSSGSRDEAMARNIDALIRMYVREEDLAERFAYVQEIVGGDDSDKLGEVYKALECYMEATRGLLEGLIMLGLCNAGIVAITISGVRRNELECFYELGELCHDEHSGHFNIFTKSIIAGSIGCGSTAEYCGDVKLEVAVRRGDVSEK